MAFITIVKAIIARSLFCLHSFIAVWKLVDIMDGQVGYWYLVGLLMLQAFEGIVSICARNGEEMKWFCPSVFLYLVSVVPTVWLMVLGVNAEARKELSASYNKTVERHDHAPAVAISDDDWVRILVQVLLVILLIGRWLLPKGELTREQLSQLLLAYMAMAADIIELFDCFKMETVVYHHELIFATLGIWTWSLLQFTLVLSATHAPKTRPSINYPPPKDMIDEMTPVDRMVHDFGENDGLLRPSVSCSPNIDLFLDMDIIAILTTVFMQDGPFFLLRLTLIFGYKVVSYLNIFFTCKNTLLVSLQLYRLFVLISKKRIVIQKRKECLRKNSLACASVEEGLGSGGEDNTEVPKERSPSQEKPLPPPPEDVFVDQSVEQALLEILEVIGEDNVIKEIEKMAQLPQEEILQSRKSTASLKTIAEPVSSSASRKVSMIQPQMEEFEEFEEEEDEDCSPPDSGFHNQNGGPCVRTVRRGTKKQQSVSKRNQEYMKRMEDFQPFYAGSDCGSFSDTDVNNEQAPFYHQGGCVSGSSTSLVEPKADGRRRQGWTTIRDRFLHNDPHLRDTQWRASAPTSLHRESSRRSTHPLGASPCPPYEYSYSPQPHRRSRHPSKASKTGGSGTIHRSNTTLHHSASVNDFRQTKYTCISESDADTLETNV
ncbi:transmembrane protein 26-like [Penaeus monodon]|uniref:transmembrane protein 26-like n=1 Tax=Penaeus monodon TaxID=6687 RepID=UPI0018A73348|nr:transmembrane protein 26-like [Penaeus monodon]